MRPVTLLPLVLLAACAIDREGGLRSPTDAGRTGRDARIVDSDGGPPRRDSGRIDAGPVLVPPDTGPVEPDAGPPLDPIGLRRLLVTLPCGPLRYVDGRGCDMPPDSRAASRVDGGDGSSVVRIALRVRGVVELNGFAGASELMPPFARDGTVERAGWSDFVLDVDDPPARWHLNAESAGVDSGGYCVPVDDRLEIDVRLGSTIRLAALAGDDRGWRNLDAGGSAISLAGVDAVTQPYDGQFIVIDLE